MNLNYGEAAETLRTEVRAFLEQNWAPKADHAIDAGSYTRSFRRRATEAGYLYRAVPKEFGGSEQTPDPILAQVIREEFTCAKAPMEVGGNGMSMLVPTLLESGTQAQKEFFIPPTVTGEFVWGQGYSEPGAGSDLASIRTRGELRGDKWIINGQKIWTSLGAKATHMFALVRTEPDKNKHQGISYLLIDLDQPGVVRRLIRQM
ncbi:MAG: acyl-CoA dehydrogenase family protein, partial [Pseudomonadota bacterium]